MIKITKEQIKELLQTQRNFDDRIETKNISDLMAAFFIEFVEWVNTVEFFKNWKQNKGKARELQLEELADMLAFGLSLMNQVGDKTGYTERQLSTLFVGLAEEQANATFELTSANFVMMLSKMTNEVIKGIDISVIVSFAYAPFMFANTYYTVDELVEAYKKKMEVNHGRQDKGY
ncbi:dUTP diphosphatase [Macrococcus armenti]|uniref:dUTP diphosphatase n=1 Tax=Macrococcus armenti TaxID=2875764 RepID=A0ABY3ZX48_9STAP|nr:dUTP diphosphatase [Macrococcus armenti]UOB21497.1 dUTP diphosphatase [Macrococcus armenti]